MKLKVTKEAKNIAQKALNLKQTLPKSKRFGLTKKQAKEKGINSGIERAKQIINSDYITKSKDIKAICLFSRWLPRKRSQRVQGAIDIWGGDKFIKKACKVYNDNKDNI